MFPVITFYKRAYAMIKIYQFVNYTGYVVSNAIKLKTKYKWCCNLCLKSNNADNNRNEEKDQ